MRSTTVVISDNARHLHGTGGEAQSCAGTVAGHSAAHPEYRGHMFPVVPICVISRSSCLLFCNLRVRAHFSNWAQSERMEVMFHLFWSHPFFLFPSSWVSRYTMHKYSWDLRQYYWFLAAKPLQCMSLDEMCRYSYIYSSRLIDGTFWQKHVPFKTIETCFPSGQCSSSSLCHSQAITLAGRYSRATKRVLLSHRHDDTERFQRRALAGSKGGTGLCLHRRKPWAPSTWHVAMYPKPVWAPEEEGT